MLVVTRAGTKKVTKLVVFTTESIRRVMILEAPHTSDAALDAAVILLEPVVQVSASPVLNLLTQS